MLSQMCNDYIPVQIYITNLKKHYLFIITHLGFKIAAYPIFSSAAVGTVKEATYSSR